MCSASLDAQPASYTYIDQKSPYKNPSGPILTVLNLPKVGTTFKVQIPNHSWSSGGGWWNHYWYRYHTFVLALGARNPDIRVPHLGGFLFTSADVLLGRSIPSRNGGAITVPLPIPNSSQLVGVRLYQQVLESVSEWGSTGWGPYQFTRLRLSRGVACVIGR